MKRILVADNEREFVRMVSRRLEALGFEVFVAFSGVEALKMARRCSLDLLVLDVMMPGKNGYDVCKELKEDSSFANIPVIFLTARDGYADKQLAHDVHGDVFLTKPLDTFKFIATIDSLIGCPAGKAR